MVAELAVNTLVSVIIPVHNGGGTLERCLRALFASECESFECIVVDDCSTDDTSLIASRFPVCLISLTGGPFGPAYARDRAVDASTSPILFFLDSDVVLHPDALSRTIDALTARRDVAALFGSYDDSPDSPDFVSQFMNLEHHFVHQHGLSEGSTFWSGCGAVRREAFLAIGGFDSVTYPHPSIEDIDLGYRLRHAGGKILLDRDIHCKHLKRWTLKSMFRTDLFSRAIPWTLLILRQNDMPNDLNLQLTQRVSALLLCAALLHLMLVAFISPPVVLLLLVGALTLVTLGAVTESRVTGIRLSWRMEAVAYLLLLGLAVLGAPSAGVLLLAPLFLVLITMFTSRHLRHSGLWSRDVEFRVVVFALAAAAGLVLASLPVWFVVPSVVCLALVVVLNYQFLAFLAHRKGLPYALAAIPYQCLYYVCSILGLAWGITLHILRTRSKRPESLVTYVRR